MLTVPLPVRSPWQSWVSSVSVLFRAAHHKPCWAYTDVCATLPALFGFLLSFYTNPWVDEAGYQNAYGAMAGISAAVIIFWVPFYLFGKRIRHSTWTWPMVAYIHWHEDRETGE